MYFSYFYSILQGDNMTSMNERNQAIISEFRANNGRVGGGFAGRTLLLLHTRGARTRETRVNPVAYMMDGERYVIIASKGGAPTHPDWYHNILAHPVVTVEVGTEKFQARATVLGEPDRTRLYNQMAAIAPSFAEYQQKTTRIIPVIALARVEPENKH
jgi:deazaflavin-dependent oxidoreductase (nitroreductase family)